MTEDLEDALHKLRWCTTMPVWSVDLSSEECSALLEEIERLQGIEETAVVVEVLE